jgi:murein DD-endopeptidase MepM/ murein hydrolase activator NlpD
MLSLACLGAALWGGYQLASTHLVQAGGILSSEWRQYLQVDRRQLKELEWQTQQQLSVLTAHIGKIEADLRKTQILGEHLVKQARLDPTEFNFKHTEISQETSESLLPSIKQLGAKIETQYVKLQAIHLALQQNLSEQEVRLSGVARPVSGGRVSSFFGARKDPLSGHRAFHGGVDIVAKEGSPVKALAAGIVKFADRKGAYGRLVEIDHGDGLSTRYGHNKQLLVKSGQLVKKGEAIALLGSSGRSTGAHLHLEVRKNGRAVDPGLYFADLTRA